MSNQLIECISNYSEARRPQVVEAILQSISAVPGVTLLDHHSDTDHNRTVVTFVAAGAVGNQLNITDSFGLQDSRLVRIAPNLMAGTAVFKFSR